MTSINFADLYDQAGQGFEPIPDGTYDIEVTKAEAVTSSTGKPMIKVQHKIVGGPHDGRQLFDQFVLSVDNPNALSFFFQHMAAFGLDRPFFAANPPMEQVAATLVGRNAVATVGTREWQGQDRNEVQGYKPGNNPAAPAGAAPSVPGPSAQVPTPPPSTTPAPDMPQASNPADPF